MHFFPLAALWKFIAKVEFVKKTDTHFDIQCVVWASRGKKLNPSEWFMLSWTFAVLLVFFALDAFIYGVCVHLYLFNPHPLALFLYLFGFCFVRSYDSFHIPIQYIMQFVEQDSASKKITLLLSHACCCIFFIISTNIFNFLLLHKCTHTQAYMPYSLVYVRGGGVHQSPVQCFQLLWNGSMYSSPFLWIFISFRVTHTSWVYRLNRTRITVLNTHVLLLLLQFTKTVKTKCGARNMVTANKLIGSNGVKHHFIGFTKYTHTSTWIQLYGVVRYFELIILHRQNLFSLPHDVFLLSQSRLFTWQQFNTSFEISIFEGDRIKMLNIFVPVVCCYKYS